MEERTRHVSLKGDNERSLLMGEVMWHQKARIQWLKESDRNTRFFHKMASCKSSNGINRLRMGEIWEDRPEVISSHMVHYFRHLFPEDWGARPRVEGISFPSISEEQKVWLEHPFQRR